MNSFYIRLYILLLLLVFIYNTNNNGWTYTDLINYTLNAQLNHSFFISDPNNILSKNQKTVLAFRMEDIFKSLNISTHIYIFNKLNIQDIKVDSSFNDDEFDLQELNDTLSDNITNGTAVSHDVYELRVKYFLKELTSQIQKQMKIKGSSIMTLLISAEDAEIQLRFGRDLIPIIKENETFDLLEFKKQRIEKKEYFTAIDHILLNFINYHKPKSFMQKMNDYINIISEIVVFIAMAYAFVYMSGPNNNVRPPQPQPSQTSTSNNKQKEKNESSESKSLNEKKNQ